MGESDETIRSALVALKHPEREADEATRWVQASRGGSDVDHPGSQRGRSRRGGGWESSDSVLRLHSALYPPSTL